MGVHHQSISAGQYRWWWYCGGESGQQFVHEHLTLTIFFFVDCCTWSHLGSSLRTARAIDHFATRQADHYGLPSRCFPEERNGSLLPPAPIPFELEFALLTRDAAKRARRLSPLFFPNVEFKAAYAPSGPVSSGAPCVPSGRGGGREGRGVAATAGCIKFYSEYRYLVSCAVCVLNHKTTDATDF